MREGALLGLQWEDLDWTRNLIDLRRTVAFRKGTLMEHSPHQCDWHCMGANAVRCRGAACYDSSS